MAQVKLQQEKLNIKITYEIMFSTKDCPFFILLRRIVVISLVVIFRTCRCLFQQLVFYQNYLFLIKM